MATIDSQSEAHSGELTVFLFSVMFRRESVKKLCTCETFAMVSAGVKYRFFFNIVLDDYDNLCRSSDIWWWWPLSSRLSCVKNHWCFMIHGCVSTCDCVVHVNRLPPDDGKHQRKIFRTRVCVSTLNCWIGQKVIDVHQTPLAFMHTSRNMYEALHLDK